MRINEISNTTKRIIRIVGITISLTIVAIIGFRQGYNYGYDKGKDKPVGKCITNDGGIADYWLLSPKNMHILTIAKIDQILEKLNEKANK